MLLDIIQYYTSNQVSIFSSLKTAINLVSIETKNKAKSEGHNS